MNRHAMELEYDDRGAHRADGAGHWPRRGTLAVVLMAALPLVAMAAGERSGSGAASDAGASTGNRIEVTGNSARDIEVRCQPGAARPAVNVNSVNVASGALHGKTVIVTGRNTQDVRVRDCPPPAAGQADGVNINSVNIR